MTWPFIAYSVSTGALGPVPVPSSKTRDWIDATPNRFARRCLPLVVANQAGWMIRTPVEFRARWNGSPYKGSIETTTEDPGHPAAHGWIMDHFGFGIITFSIPYVFRTPPGVGLLVRGAPNFWIEGAHALEGLVETDWSYMTFTMNWKIIAPHQWVEFRAGDPVCFLQPVQMDLIETAEPAVKTLAEDPEVEAAYKAWSDARFAFNANPERKPEDWQKDYFIGKGTGSHRKRMQVPPFIIPGFGEARCDPGDLQDDAGRRFAEEGMPDVRGQRESPGLQAGHRPARHQHVFHD